MIGGLIRAWDNLFGLGDAAVTVPPLDGALRPNRKLDEASSRFPLVGVDCLAAVSGELFASSANTLYVYENGKDWRKRNEYEDDIACIAAVGDDKLAVALTTGDIFVDERQYRVADDVRCITAIASSGAEIYVANGSATNSPDMWQLDLMQRNASGSIWRIDLESGKSTQIADKLAYPAGLAVEGSDIIYSEAWKHQIVRIDGSGTGHARTLYTDLPGYPGRITLANSGYWMAVFAPRSQLVEHVLREPAYRKRMIEEVPMSYWIAPKLRSGRSFYESLQGGGIKHFGQLKPWAPTMSAGLCVKLDEAFQPSLSLQSRADGMTHGVTSLVEYQGRVFAAARGDDVVVSIPLEDLGDDE